MYPICSSPAGDQPTPQQQPPPKPVKSPSTDSSLPPHPSPTRARLSSFDIDRHFEDRLRSLSPPAPVSVYLPPPRTDELQQRLERLQASDRGERPVDEAELERRLKRLQGEHVSAEKDTMHSPPAATAPSPPPPPSSMQPLSVYGGGVDELDVLLRQVQDEVDMEGQVKLDYEQVYGTALQLGHPLDSSSHSHTHQATEGSRGSEETESEVERLMNELQRLPGTEIVKLKHAAGSNYHSDADNGTSDDDNG